MLSVQFTRHDAMAMVRMGIIPEDASTELLDGYIVLKDRAARGQSVMTIGNAHTVVVERLSDLRARINTPQRHVRSQQPLLCSETHVPEPDFMVLRGQIGDYADLPTATDVYCVVEVADSSYEIDAGDKLRGYARAGVEQYVIINLRNRTAEIYTGADRTAGTYLPPRVVTADEPLPLRVAAGEFFTVALGEVLP
jgi:hypothetical protein